MTTNEKPIFELHPRKGDDSASKIETIKNLIFGDSLKSFENEFETLKADILFKRKELQDLMDETRAGLQKAIEDVSDDVNTRLSQLEEKLTDRLEHIDGKTVNSDDLGDFLVELGKKIKGR